MMEGQRNKEREVKFNALGVRRIAGAAAGVVAGCLFLTLGFWRAFLIIALAAIGWWVGGGCYFSNFALGLVNRVAARFSKRNT